MRYQVLVADDEQMIRRGIISFLNTYDDFEVVCEAEDGEMALEMAMGRHIDVYFVDIMMPFLNGLDFIKELKKVHPDALVVIITGYDRFEYARDSIRLGAFEYLLKPIREDAFEEMIQRVTSELEKNKITAANNRYLEWAKTRLDEKHQSLVTDLISNILNVKLTSTEVFDELQFLNVDFPINYDLLLIASEYQRAEDLHNYWNEELIKFTLQNAAGETFASLGHDLYCFDSAGRLVMITEAVDEDALAEKISAFSLFIRSLMPVKCTVVSKSGTGIENVPIIYHAAERTLKKASDCSDVMSMVLDFIEKNYKKEELSLQDVAAEVNLSIPYLSKLFKKEMDTTFVDYLTNLRIRRAIEFLQDDSMRMYEIAENVGYSSQHYFSNVFKKKTGLSPNEYKRSIMNDKNVLNIAK